METVAENARKCPHCHSYIDKDAQPKRASEAADLVIKFVGFTTAAFTIVGSLAIGGLAFLGYRSFENLESDLKLDVTRKIGQEVDKVRAEFQGLQAVARKSIIDYLYARYRTIFTSLVLEYLTKETLNDLEGIENNLILLKAGGSDNKLDEMEKMIHAVKDFTSGRAEDLEHALSDLKSLSNNNSVKYRMLVSIHSKRFKQHINERDKAESDLIDLRDAAQRYYDLERNTVLANMMRAIACAREAVFIERYNGDESEQRSKYEQAIDFLKQADRIDPMANSIHYNIAAYYSRMGRLDEAMNELKIVHQRGELRRPNDVDFFKHDPDFDKLWNSTYREQLESLYGRRA